MVQMCSTADLAANLAEACRWVGEAAAAGAKLVALPENFACLCREGEAITCAQGLDGEIVGELRRWAQRHRLYLLGGSFPEVIPGEKRVYNTSVFITPNGEIGAVYRKIHLFDVDLSAAGGAHFQESARIAPGNELCVAETEFGGVGLSICYDLRFPELYRALVDRGARFLAVPSAFTCETGKDHWAILLRARAIENQCFVLAPAQWGRHAPDRTSYGRALIADPWGIVIAQAPDQPCAIVADCCLETQDRLRVALPALSHRRLRG